MRITYGANAAPPSITRFEVAWSFPHAEFGPGKDCKKLSWWLDSVHPNEHSGRSRLKEIENAVCKNRGNVAVYRLDYDERNRIVSEQVVANRGGERPPFRSDVGHPSPQLKAAFAQLVRPQSIRKLAARSRSRRRIVASIFIAGGFAAVLGLAVLTAGNAWWQSPERGMPDRVKVEADRIRNRAAEILLPRPNSSMCDRLLFDNGSGRMRAVEALPCGRGAAPKAGERVNAFKDSWRGIR